MKPGSAIDLADLIWQLLDPAGYNAMQLAGVEMNRPHLIQKRAERTPDIGDRVMDYAPELYGTIVERNAQFKHDVNHGPLSGEDLDKIILNSMKIRAGELKTKKGGML
jgi:hypothetical protein